MFVRVLGVLVVLALTVGALRAHPSSPNTAVPAFVFDVAADDIEKVALPDRTLVAVAETPRPILLAAPASQAGVCSDQLVFRPPRSYAFH